MENIFGKYFKITLTGLIFFELLSLLGYLQPLVGQTVFFTIILITLILSLIKLDYGLYIILAELFTASKGYLFYLEIDGFLISLRIALFLILISVWLAKVIVYYFKNRTFGPYFRIRQSGLLIFYFLFFCFLFWGIIIAFLRQNSFSNIFFDANGWLYFGLVFVFFDAIISATEVKNILQIFFASVLVLCLKTLMLLFVFSHQMIEMLIFYRWLSDSGLAEITEMGAGFYRIFFQSQIYILIALFVLITFIYTSARIKGNLSFKKINKENFLFLIFNILFLSSIIVSLSRSFWIGLIGGSVGFVVIILFQEKEQVISLFRLAGYCLGVLIFSLILIFAIVEFPYPKPTGVSLASLLSERALSISGEAAAASRWNLLSPLWQEIKNNFFLGAGFGKTVTYQSQDPRQLSLSQGGFYTTYAFEWGYLDIWLKLGLLGLIGYLVLIYQIWQKGWQKLKNNFQDYPFKKSLILGFLLGMIVIASTSIFSPYLNHPLGIGYLILVSAIFEVL